MVYDNRTRVHVSSETYIALCDTSMPSFTELVFNFNIRGNASDK